LYFSVGERHTVRGPYSLISFNPNVFKSFDKAIVECINIRVYVEDNAHHPHNQTPHTPLTV